MNIRKSTKEKKQTIREQFLQRFKLSKEYLDLGDLLLGLNRDLKVANPDHEFLIMDILDVKKDYNAGQEIFDKVIHQCNVQAAHQDN
jgi:hypothetical protein